MKSLCNTQRGTFIDVTLDIAPGLNDICMVTDICWVDFNDDDQIDFLLTGEWMPLTYFENVNGKYKNKTNQIGLDGTNGWWSSIAKGDFDRDEDIDFLCGNLGLNSRYRGTKEAPFQEYNHDFNNSGTNDIVLALEENGVKYPLRCKDCLAKQNPFIKRKYSSSKKFAFASIIDIFSME